MKVDLKYYHQVQYERENSSTSTRDCCDKYLYINWPRSETKNTIST